MALRAVHKRGGLTLRRWPGITLGLCLLIGLLILSTFSFATIDLTIFGPKQYNRLKGKPTVYVDTFDRCNPATEAILKVQNGDGKKTRIKSARIYVNGVKVAKEYDFKQKVPSFEKLITIQEHNELKVILKSGQHGYLDKLAKYQAKKTELEQELARLQDLRESVRREREGYESGVTSQKSEVGQASRLSSIENFLREIQEIGKKTEERNEYLDRIDRSLEDSAEDEEDESAPDDEPEIDAAWVSEHKAELEIYRKEIKDTINEAENALDALDRAPPKKKSKDISSVSSVDSVAKKKDSLKDLIKLLKELDHAIEKALDRLSDIERKIEKITKKGPSFLIIEIIGKGCDSTPPVVSNPKPADGSLLNTATPGISGTLEGVSEERRTARAQCLRLNNFLACRRVHPAVIEEKTVRGARPPPAGCFRRAYPIRNSGGGSA